jgi:pimeloyl-ACP methyl ester carboxylesterase
MTIPLVLVHGGGFDSRCWELLVPRLAAPVIAVDLPGRGRRPAAPESVTFADCAQAIVEDIDAAGFEEVVLVGHSQAGCSLPRVMALLGERVRHAVFVAALVPEDGRSSMQELTPHVSGMIDDHVERRRDTMDPAMAKVVFGNDLDDDQFAWCLARLVPEPPGLPNEPVELSGLRESTPRTWVRTTRDAILPPDMQLRFVERVGRCPVIDLDAGHMCMISQPEALAAILEGLVD